MTVVSAFMLFVFSTLGMSMLFYSQIYLKLSSYKKNSIILDFASENGIKQGFNAVTQNLSGMSSLTALTLAEFHRLQADVHQKGVLIIERLLGMKIPIDRSASWENLRWNSTTDFTLSGIKETSDHFISVYKGIILSRGEIVNFKTQSLSSLGILWHACAGFLPLPKIPVLIDRVLTPAQKAAFLKQNLIKIAPSQIKNVAPAVHFSDKRILPQNASSQLSKVLKINIFHPQNLTPAVIRKALGLKVSNEPVPDGVYLIKDDMGLGGIYIQGDLDEMILAIDGDYQAIKFISGPDQWVLRFSPAQGKTVFRTPSGTSMYDLVPIGMITVNGKIRSLGGGTCDLAGNIIPVKDQEIPCVHRSVSLTIVSSDEITLTSHLIHQGVIWKDGIPYVKDSRSQLNIFASGKDFIDNTDLEGKITIDSSAPQNLKVQASLTASKKGVVVAGRNKTVHLFGSLHTSDYLSSGNSLEITPDERQAMLQNLHDNAPKTTEPVLYLSLFQVLDWIENL